MSDFISQEEIDALLNGVSAPSAPKGLTTSELDTLGEVGNIGMGTSATTLTQILGRNVTIITPIVSEMGVDDVCKAYEEAYVGIKVEYSTGLNGVCYLILKDEDVKKITDIMMGGDGTNIQDEISDLHLSAISEAMNQMVGSASTSLAQMIKSKIDINPPKVSKVKFEPSAEIFDELEADKKIVVISFDLEVEDLVKGKLIQMLPISFSRGLVAKFAGVSEVVSKSVEPEENELPYVEVPEEIPDQKSFETANVYSTPQQSLPQQMHVNQAYPQPNAGDNPYGMPMQPNPGDNPYGMPMQPNPGDNPYGMPMQPNMGMPQMGYQGGPYGYAQQMPMNYGPGQGGDGGSNHNNRGQSNVNVQPASFQSLEEGKILVDKKNVDIIMDVPLQVTVELGRTNRLIKDILDFGTGTIIELDKLAGEPVDILVNGKIIAKGEVVVIDESFGVRITEIIQPQLRV